MCRRVLREKKNILARRTCTEIGIWANHDRTISLSCEGYGCQAATDLDLVNMNSYTELRSSLKYVWQNPRSYRSADKDARSKDGGRSVGGSQKQRRNRVCAFHAVTGTRAEPCPVASMLLASRVGLCLRVAGVSRSCAARRGRSSRT